MADPKSKNFVPSLKEHYRSASSYVWTRVKLAVNPNLEKSATRSVRPEYFVFGAWSPSTGCVLSVMPPDDRKDISESFYDPCSGVIFDAAGRATSSKRLVRGHMQTHPSSFNLYLPPYRMTSQDTVEIGLSKDAVIPELPEEFKPVYSHLTPTERLLEAASFNDRKEVQAALDDGAEVNYFAIGKGSPIDSAILGSSIEIVKLLIKHGARASHNSKTVAEMEYSCCFSPMVSPTM